MCGNYRGISLLSVPGKVYTVVILNHIRHQLNASLNPYQLGYRPDQTLHP